MNLTLQPKEGQDVIVNSNTSTITVSKDVYKALMVDSAMIRQLTQTINEDTADSVTAARVKEVLQIAADLYQK